MTAIPQTVEDWIPSRIFQILEELPPISEDGTEAKSKTKKEKNTTSKK
jgi:hypothetical protein